MGYQDRAKGLLGSRLQQRSWPIFQDGRAHESRTIIVVPSFTLDSREMRKIAGAVHFEERLLFLVQLLLDAGTRVVYLTSQPLTPTMVDYAMDIVTSLPSAHARRRLTLLDCGDSSPTPLTQKILDRSDLVERMRREISSTDTACLVPFNCTPLERELAERLGVPLYGCDPALSPLGLKSGSRQLLRRAEVPVLAGYEQLRDIDDVVQALAALKSRDPALSKAVIKLNDSFGGGGNAIFAYSGVPGHDVESWIRKTLPRRAVFAAGVEPWDSFVAKLNEMGAVVERFVEPDDRRSPSAQLEISPTGQVDILSTHDQVLGGVGEQVYLGCTFPADPRYRLDIQRLAMRAGEALANESVTGILSIDFLSERVSTGWRHYGLEINLRMGGGTAPCFMLQGLVEGRFVVESGDYVTPEGDPRSYFACDRLQRDSYRRLSPEDAIDAVASGGLHYSSATRAGAVLYMLGALADVGKVGVVAVAHRPQAATELYEEVVAALEAAAARRA